MIFLVFMYSIFLVFYIQYFIVFYIQYFIDFLNIVYCCFLYIQKLLSDDGEKKDGKFRDRLRQILGDFLQIFLNEEESGFFLVIVIVVSGENNYFFYCYICFIFGNLM